VPEEDLVDLHRRIAAARWPSRELVADRSQAVQLATIRELARYWTTDYNWRACETKPNALPQFTTGIDGFGIHFIREVSRRAELAAEWPRDEQSDFAWLRGPRGSPGRRRALASRRRASGMGCRAADKTEP
jgi:hypothetical protein